MKTLCVAIKKEKNTQILNTKMQKLRLCEDFWI